MVLYRQPEWKTPIDMKLVNFTLDMINKYPVVYPNESKKLRQIDRSIGINNDFIINDVYISRISENAIFFTDSILLRLHHSWYPIRFSIPKTCIRECDESQKIVDEVLDEISNTMVYIFVYNKQSIVINRWAYEKCYIEAINRTLQNHAKHLISILNSDPELPMISTSEYGRFVIRVQLNNTKNKNEVNYENKKNIREENIKMVNEKHSIPKTKYIFYVDGSGNIANDKKFKDKGHYSILLENTQEKWRHDDDALTSNQAELKGILAAMLISLKRGYNNIEIYTDSQNSINWATGIWKAKSPNIIDYVMKVMEFKEKFNNIKFIKIPRDRNKAHPI